MHTSAPLVPDQSAQALPSREAALLSTPSLSVCAVWTVTVCPLEPALGHLRLSPWPGPYPLRPLPRAGMAEAGPRGWLLWALLLHLVSPGAGGRPSTAAGGAIGEGAAWPR